MRNLIIWNLITLDGFFEGAKSWELDWHNLVWGEELDRLSIEQLKTAGMLLFGRVTYEGMASYWSAAKGEVAEVAERMNAIPKIVFSRTLEKAEWNNTRLIKENAVEEVIRLKREPGKDLFIFGSADLSSAFMQHGLIDEYRLGVVPVILGGGNPLFKPAPQRMKMKLIDVKTFATGFVILRYQPAKV
jgi:dihydrofolate reductase